MRYTVAHITCPEACREMLIAELDYAGFSSFWEHEKGFDAYYEQQNFDVEILDAIIKKYNQTNALSYSLETVTDYKNWNEEWEKNFQPIIIEDQCLVRASFHPASNDFPYEIVINPKMSFGTGHHETTYLMLSQQLEMDFEHKKVLDVGCGTGILSIMAAKRGAQSVVACDIDEWPVQNSRENFALNRCDHIEIYQGTVNKVPHQWQYDVILANINRNVLLDEMPAYVAVLAPGACLLLSGFYESDAEVLLQKAEENHLELADKRTKNNWAMLLLRQK